MELYTPPASPQPENQPPQNLQQARAVRLSEVRRRRQRKKCRMLALLALLAVVVIAALAGAFRSSVTALADLGDSIRIGLTPGGSYPVKTGIGQLYQVEKLAGGFVELGEKDVVLASASGLKLRTIQHGYARPALAVGGSRFCVYNRAGYTLRVESRSQNLYTQTLDNAILVCGMSQNGSLAVATRSNRYTAEVKVYSPNFVYRYGWNTTDSEGTPIRIAFAPDNKRLAVACLRADAGQMTTGIYLLDTRKDAVNTDIQAQGSTLLQLSWVGSSQLLAVYDHYTALYDAATGKERARFEYGDHLLDASISGKYVGLLLGTKGGATQLVTLGTNLNQLAQVNGSGAVGVTVTGTAVYQLDQSGVTCLTLKGVEKWRAKLGVQPQAVVSAKKLLVFTGSEAALLTAPEQNG